MDLIDIGARCGDWRASGSRPRSNGLPLKVSPALEAPAALGFSGGGYGGGEVMFGGGYAPEFWAPQTVWPGGL